MKEAGTAFQRTPIRPLSALSEAAALLSGCYWLFLGITLVGVIIGSAAPFGILMGPMMCGIYRCYLGRMRGETIRFAMLFDGFEHFVESLIVSVIVAGVMLVLIVPTYVLLFLGIGLGVGLTGDGRSGSGLGVAVALLMVAVFVLILAVAMVVAACTIFAYPLIVDRGLKGLDALKTSIRATWANLPGIVGLMILIAVIGFAGAMCCYVPALLLMPLTMGALAVAYRRVFPESLPVGEGS